MKERTRIGGGRRRPASGRRARSGLREETLLEQLLRLDAVLRPRNRLEPRLADLLTGVQAEAVGAGLQPLDGEVDLVHELALAVGDREGELAGVGVVGA